MTDITTYMINPAGGVKKIPSRMVEEMLAKGWIILPQNQLTATGNPKQQYYPQMDRQVASREKRIDGTGNGTGDMLHVEVF